MGKRTAVLLAMLFLALGARGSQGWEGDSGYLGQGGSRLCSGYPQHHVFQSPPDALVSGGDEVTIRFYARADLDATDEWIDVDINFSDFDENLGGPTLGRLFRIGGNTGCTWDMNGGVSGINPTAVYTMDAADWNALLDSGGGDVRFDFNTPSTVECLACSGCKCGTWPENPFSWVHVIVSYTGVECNSNLECDDDLFCNGEETCNASGSCQSGSDPCPGELRDEVNDRCLDCGGVLHVDDDASAGRRPHGVGTDPVGFVGGVFDGRSARVADV